MRCVALLTSSNLSSHLSSDLAFCYMSGCCDKIVSVKRRNSLLVRDEDKVGNPPSAALSVLAGQISWRALLWCKEWTATGDIGNKHLALTFPMNLISIAE